MHEFASQAPVRRDKRRGAWLGLYDAPLLRDWLFYWTFFWTALTGYAIATTSGDPDRQSTLPIWLDVLFAALLGALILGILPACLRRALRALIQYVSRARTQKRSGDGAHSSPKSLDKSEDHLEVGRQKNVGEPRRSVETPHVVHKDLPQPTQQSRVAQNLPLINTDAVGDQARSHQPYPVARAARALQVAADPRERYEAVLKAAEATCVVLGSTAAAWACKEGVAQDAVARLRDALLTQGASQGHWLDVAQAVQQPMSQSLAAIPGMAEFLRKQKGGTGVVESLKKLINERNSWAHGAGPRTPGEHAERLLDLLPLIEGVLQQLTFFEASPWIYVKDSRLRRRERDFSIDAYRAMGDHPDFDLTIFHAHAPLADDNFYVLAPQEPIDLTPLVVMRPCPTCHQPEVAHAHKHDPTKGLMLKTFDRGHVFYDKLLVQELREMLPSN